MTSVNLESRIVRRRGLASAALSADEIVLMNSARDHYFGLESVGRRIWGLLSVDRSVIEICEVLQKEYDVDPNICERETVKFIEDLLKEELVVVSDQVGG